MNRLEEQLHSAGLQVVDHCERLATYGPDLLEHSPLLEQFTPAEADVLPRRCCWCAPRPDRC